MLKSELIIRLAGHNPHLFQRDVENVVNAVFDEIVAALARGDRVELRGFGTFAVRARRARIGRLGVALQSMYPKRRYPISGRVTKSETV